MKKRTRNLLIAAGAALASLIFYVYTNANKNGIVIRHRYSGWRNMNTASTILLALSGAVLVLILAFYGYMNWRQKKMARSEQEQEAQREADLIESKKLRTPEDIRQFIIGICNSRPHCQTAKLIKDQLDEMNGYQDRLERLLEINDTEMAKETVRGMLQQTENEICDDCRSVINAFVVDDVEGFESAARPVYESNAYKLKKAKEFLDNLKMKASEPVTSGDAVQNLEFFGQAINSSTDKEGY